MGSHGGMYSKSPLDEPRPGFCGGNAVFWHLKGWKGISEGGRPGDFCSNERFF